MSISRIKSGCLRRLKYSYVRMCQVWIGAPFIMWKLWCNTVSNPIWWTDYWYSPGQSRGNSQESYWQVIQLYTAPALWKPDGCMTLILINTFKQFVSKNINDHIGGDKKENTNHTEGNIQTLWKKKCSFRLSNVILIRLLFWCQQVWVSSTRLLPLFSTLFERL